MQLNQHLTNADAHPQFLVSKIVLEGELLKKYPCSPQGIIKFSHKDAKNWMTLTEAQERIALLNAFENSKNYKLGFSILATSKFFFIDIDKCYIETFPGSGVWDWSAIAKLLCARFQGCYIEVSQSGTGLHIIGTYTGETPPHLNKISGLGIELYTDDRYVMLTGDHATGNWHKDATAEFHSTITEYFNKQSFATETQPVNTPYVSTLTDEEVKQRATDKSRPSKVFGNRIGANFDDLFTRNVEVLALAFPPRSQGKEFDESEADMSMASMLQWAGADEEQTNRIMRESALARDKWDQREGYLADTIHKCVSARQHMQLTQPDKHTTATDTCQPLVDEMPQEYQGCYYVRSQREIYSVPHAALLNKDAFVLHYTIPFMKEKPYKTFQDHASITGHIVDTMSFKPELPHGAITLKEGRKSINTYTPINIDMQKGDMTPFFHFLDKMLPDKRDQRIILSYIATLIQKPGVKAMWCPVLQGVQGCGKSFLADLVAYVVGERYTHRAKGDEFENRFTQQWFGKLLMLVEDVQLKKAKLEDLLKMLVTSKTYAFEGKGSAVFMGDFPLNFLITSNDIDVIRKNKETRRFAFFMCAQQSDEDKVNSGMTSDFFSNLIKWRDNGGYEFFAYFIHNYIPDAEFDFSNGCNTAPHTSTTDQAIEANRSEVELLILEQIESGRAGFKGGVISGTMLSKLFQESGNRFFLRNCDRSKVLKNLNYVLHPHLVNGRAPRIVSPDGNRPALFVKIGSPIYQITDKEQIMKAYEDAQK